MRESGLLAGSSEHRLLIYKGVPFAAPPIGPLYQAPGRSRKADLKLAEQMSTYWTNFAKTGNPNGPGLPVCPAYANADPRVLYLADPIADGDVYSIGSLTVLDQVYAAVRGSPLAAP